MYYYFDYYFCDILYNIKQHKNIILLLVYYTFPGDYLNPPFQFVPNTLMVMGINCGGQGVWIKMLDTQSLDLNSSATRFKVAINGNYSTSYGKDGTTNNDPDIPMSLVINSSNISPTNNGLTNAQTLFFDSNSVSKLPINEWIGSHSYFTCGKYYVKPKCLWNTF